MTAGQTLRWLAKIQRSEIYKAPRERALFLYPEVFAVFNTRTALALSLKAQLLLGTKSVINRAPDHEI